MSILDVTSIHYSVTQSFVYNACIDHNVTQPPSCSSVFLLFYYFVENVFTKRHAQALLVMLSS